MICINPTQLFSDPALLDIVEAADASILHAVTTTLTIDLTIENLSSPGPGKDILANVKSYVNFNFMVQFSDVDMANGTVWHFKDI